MSLDNLASLLSLDFAYIGDQGMRGLLSGILEVPGMYSSMTGFIQASTPDYFEGGKVFGKIIKLVFDYNISN